MDAPMQRAYQNDRGFYFGNPFEGAREYGFNDDPYVHVGLEERDPYGHMGWQNPYVGFGAQRGGSFGRGWRGGPFRGNSFGRGFRGGWRGRGGPHGW